MQGAVELLERDGLLAALNAAAEAAARGEGGTVLVSGEAGIGKTSLLERFAAGIGRGRVLWGACEALATPRPLGPLHDIAGEAGMALRGALARPGDRATLFGAVLDELARPPAPTVVVFEDVHWADDATLDLVKYLGRRIRSAGALLVLSHRDDPASLDKLRGVLGNLPAAHVARLAVPPLSRTAVEQLAARVARRDAVGVHVATGGNAFFVTEVLRHGGATTGVPVTVRDAVLARAATLPPRANELLQLVAIVPRQVDLALLADVLAPTTETIEACLASGLLVADGASLRFRHELARTAIEEALPPPRAAALQRRVLAALEARPDGETSLAARAHHAQKAGDAAAILRWSPRAAQRRFVRGARRQRTAAPRSRTAIASPRTTARRCSTSSRRTASSSTSSMRPSQRANRRSRSGAAPATSSGRAMRSPRTRCRSCARFATPTPTKQAGARSISRRRCRRRSRSQGHRRPSPTCAC